MCVVLAPPSAGVTAAPKPKYLARVGKLGTFFVVLGLFPHFTNLFESQFVCLDVNLNLYLTHSTFLVDENLYFHTDNAAPIIMIVRAVYGYLQDNTKLIDVTMEVQNMVKGRFLEIGKEFVNVDCFYLIPCIIYVPMNCDWMFTMLWLSLLRYFATALLFTYCFLCYDSVDLDKVFTNPCKGLRKSLKVSV